MIPARLFDTKNECCGCTACLSVCPRDAIQLKADEYGFLYPLVDEKKCIGCHKCESVCAFQSGTDCNEPLKVYAGICKDDVIRSNSTSGGIFAVLAQEILRAGGFVYGAEMGKNGSGYWVRHIGLSDVSEYYRLQGSKYMQSDLEGVFREIKEKLINDCYVLFSGTPCQVDGLLHYLGRNYERLVTVDVLCHGVPSAKMFNDYIAFEKQSKNADDFSIEFRNKKDNHWSHGAVLIIKKKNKYFKKTVHYNLSSFYMSFMDGHIFRDSCYQCKYASKHRPGDITLGDYWGIQKVHPELLKDNGGIFDETMGISCIIVNTQKGIDLLHRINSKIMIAESDFEKASRANAALTCPVSIPKDRDEYMSRYRVEGYQAIDQMYRKHYRKQFPVFKLKNAIPYKIKRAIRAIRRL